MGEDKLTLGQYRVGINFNPEGNPAVNEIKQRSAKLITLMTDPLIVDQSNPEACRCAALAMTKFEEAAMWAVKAATKPAMPQE